MSAALPKTDVYRTSSQGGLFGFNSKIFAYESGNDRACLVKTRDVQKTLFILASECRGFRAFRAWVSLSTRVALRVSRYRNGAVRATSAFPLIAPEDQT